MTAEERGGVLAQSRVSPTPRRRGDHRSTLSWRWSPRRLGEPRRRQGKEKTRKMGQQRIVKTKARVSVLAALQRAGGVIEDSSGHASRRVAKAAGGGMAPSEAHSVLVKMAEEGWVKLVPHPARHGTVRVELLRVPDVFDDAIAVHESRRASRTSRSRGTTPTADRHLAGMGVHVAPPLPTADDELARLRAEAEALRVKADMYRELVDELSQRLKALVG